MRRDDLKRAGVAALAALMAMATLAVGLLLPAGAVAAARSRYVPLTNRTAASSERPGHRG
ncbi:MAG: hypothetical protein JO342_19600 [Solirubrobacterales bacterium]|nr:hypothetical protein [Solirubrobacterales bacterium]